VNAKGAEDTVNQIAEITKTKGKAIFVPGDVRKSEEVKNIMDKAFSTFGKLNILVNNAGIMHNDDDNAMTTDEKIWDLTMEVNLKGVFLCCKHGIPYLQKSGGGSIINTASFVALRGAATPQVAYTASKGGVLAFTREIAIIHAKENIRANSLCPGPLRTKLLMDFLNTEEKRQRRLVHLPTGRFGEAREMAEAIAFLASDESSYITGTDFLADGGLSAAYVTPL
jgi:NAD(P)-dependent dehydrogenase (short-subunit alcohol dehydrogenase family)